MQAKNKKRGYASFLFLFFHVSGAWRVCGINKAIKAGLSSCADKGFAGQDKLSDRDKGAELV